MLLETDNTGHAIKPDITADTSGTVTTVWSQSDGTRLNLHAARYLPASGWTAPELIETDNAGDAQDAGLTVDPTGIVTAASGPPGTWADHPHGKQWRLYGPAGSSEVDIDFGHDHGQGQPHAHNWENGERGPGVPVSIVPTEPRGP